MTELEPAESGAQEHVSFLKVILKFRPAKLPVHHEYTKPDI